jgi:DNA-binding transcriptional MocR family regulator
MHMLYAERQGYLLEAARRTLAGLLELEMAEAGMHLPGWLPEAIDDLAASQRAATYGIDAPPLSAYCIEPERASDPREERGYGQRERACGDGGPGVPVPASAPGRRPRHRGALLLGYANCSQQEIDQGVERLARALSTLQEPVLKR